MAMSQKARVVEQNDWQVIFQIFFSERHLAHTGLKFWESRLLKIFMFE